MIYFRKIKDLKNVRSFGTQEEFSDLGNSFFLWLEPAVVLDVILDSSHPILSKNSARSIDVENWPVNLNFQKPKHGEVDYSIIGSVLVRPIYSQNSTEKDKLILATSLDSSIIEYPLINEVVFITEYNGKYFYLRRINFTNFPNESVDFLLNDVVSNSKNTELYSEVPYSGVISKKNFDGSGGNSGVVGKYFKINNQIRRIKKNEGDLVIESRFGQSIRFWAYDGINSENNSGPILNKSYIDGGGNPCITIRNRQRNLLNVGETMKLSGPYPSVIKGTVEEKNAGGYIEEDINYDGSTIQITSGKIVTKWVTTCYKKMHGTGEEVADYEKSNTYNFPKLDGDQIVINSDRLIFSSRYGEIFNFSKKRYGIITDADFSLDAHEKIVLTTHEKVAINSPAIFLGEIDDTNEPAVLGQTLANWLYQLCEWLENHVHWYIHSHVDAGKESPSQTQLPVQMQQLIDLKQKIQTILSRRVFLAGGGFAPGRNGVQISQSTKSPVEIDVLSGKGVPGGWKGSNYRKTG